jgi:hypothetical protein
MNHRPQFSNDSAGSAGLPIGLSADDERRERAIRLLTDAYAYDVITDVEFERRLGLLGVAATPSSIDAVVADLARGSMGVREAPAGYHPPPLMEGRIVGLMSETRRNGPWRVPQRLSIRAIMSNVKIDLRYAAIPSGCSIEVRAIMANVTFIAPPGMVVDFGIDPIMGSVRNDAEGTSMTRQPHLRISGTALMAEVRVRVRRYGK